MLSFKDILSSFLRPKSVKCTSRGEEVVMDDPAYAQLDPHLKFDESEDSIKNKK